MTVFAHLSDLHLNLAKHAGRQGLVFDRLVHTLAAERSRRALERMPLVITGDVFDSASGPSEPLVSAFLRLHARLLTALGPDSPTIILPGNHDRRRFGLVGPHRTGLFQALFRAVDPSQVFVGGCKSPFLAEIVPRALHGLPAHIVTFDSSYLPKGLLSAGGTIRLEDLLQVHAELPEDDLPLLLLVHHHLIPTPVTDVSHVDSLRAPRALRFLVGKVLPALVSNADREELTMTALGAGTALSTLNSFGRAVLLLHGHKHVPTARVLRGMTDDSGDILIASAGTAGLRERVHATRHPDAARLWPTFNLVDLEADRVSVETLSFSPKRRSKPPVRRHLAQARLVERKWELDPISLRARDAAQRLALDRADYKLTRSPIAPQRFDFECERAIELEPGASLRRYVDFVHAVPLLAPRSGDERRRSRRIEVEVGGITRFRVEAGLCRTLAEGERCYGTGTAFEWIGLLSRYGARRSVLSLARPGAEWLKPFASVTDLTTGREQPLPLKKSPDFWAAIWSDCAPRSLLRIYWPLDSA
jgi:3',5'-cyclic AMP phosphodiesterase CpdA